MRVRDHVELVLFAELAGFRGVEQKTHRRRLREAFQVIGAQTDELLIDGSVVVRVDQDRDFAKVP